MVKQNELFIDDNEKPEDLLLDLSDDEIDKMYNETFKN